MSICVSKGRFQDILCHPVTLRVPFLDVEGANKITNQLIITKQWTDFIGPAAQSEGLIKAELQK